MATPVVIVQDKKSLSTLIAMIVGNVLQLLLSGWIVMLLLPYVTPWAPGYWQTVAGLVVVGTAVKTDVGTLVRLYTRPPS